MSEECPNFPPVPHSPDSELSSDSGAKFKPPVSRRARNWFFRLPLESPPKYDAKKMIFLAFYHASGFYFCLLQTDKFVEFPSTLFPDALPPMPLALTALRSTLASYRKMALHEFGKPPLPRRASKARRTLFPRLPAGAKEDDFTEPKNCPNDKEFARYFMNNCTVSINHNK